MAHKVETMAFAGDVPWHGLGFPVKDTLTPDQMMRAAKCDWTVSKKPIKFANNGHDHEVDGSYALIRDTDNRVMSLVGDKYKPVQNSEMFDFFKKFTKAGHMKMETAGSLWDGKFVWALARIGKDFKVLGKDDVQSYLLILSPHALGYALVMQYTPIRVVCWNTLNFALGASLKGGKGAFRMPHIRSFADNVSRAEQALGLAVKQNDEFKDAATFLAKAKAKPFDVVEYFYRVLDVNKEDIKKEPVALPKFQAALERAPGQQLITAKGTWWGALNAVTYVLDHGEAKERQTGLKNAWLGNYANIKRRALSLALESAS